MGLYQFFFFWQTKQFMDSMCHVLHIYVRMCIFMSNYDGIMCMWMYILIISGVLLLFTVFFWSYIPVSSAIKLQLCQISSIYWIHKLLLSIIIINARVDFWPLFFSSLVKWVFHHSFYHHWTFTSSITHKGLHFPKH